MAYSKRHLGKVLAAAVPVSLIVAVAGSFAANGQSAPTSSNEAHTTAKTETSVRTETQANGPAAARTTVTVNGQNVPVPESGTVHRVIQQPNGSTTLDVSVDHQGGSSATTTSSNSVDVQVHSSSSNDGAVP